MRIVNEGEFKNAFDSMRSQLKKFNACEILFDNPMYVTAELSWLTQSGFKRAARNAFMYDRTDFDENLFLTDYMVIQKEKGDIPALLLFGALRKDIISEIGTFLKENKIKPAGFDMAVSGILTFVAKSHTFDRKNSIIRLIDGNLLSIYSFSGKGSLFTAKAIINERAGSPPYYNRIASEISKHASFKRTERVRQGLAKEGFIYIFDSNGQLSFDSYNKALRDHMTIEDFFSIGVRPSFGEESFSAVKSDIDADRFAPLLGVLTNR
jgi:hypothetical protein